MHRAQLAGADPARVIAEINARSERQRVRTNERGFDERHEARRRHADELESAAREQAAARERANQRYRDTIDPPESVAERDRQARLWRLLLTGVTITAQHPACIWNPQAQCTCSRTAPKDCPFTPVPPQREDTGQTPDSPPATPVDPPVDPPAERPVDPPADPPGQQDTGDAPADRPAPPSDTTVPSRDDAQTPHADQPTDDEPSVTIPPAGDQAIPEAMDAARRAAERLGAEFTVLEPNRATVALPGGETIELIFTTDRLGQTQALVVTRDGRVIRISLSTDASAADIAVEVASGVSTALLYDMPDHRFGSESVLHRDGEARPGTTPSRNDARQIARLHELAWQHEHTTGPLADAAAVALNDLVDQLGLDLDSGPDAADRRALIPEELRDRLAVVLPDWESAHTHAPELGDEVRDRAIVREARDIGSTPADEAFEDAAYRD